MLFAEGSSTNHSSSEQTNIAAAYMTCDAETGLTQHIIEGRALLLREGGGDLEVDTVKKLCSFVQDMMGIWPTGHSPDCLQHALKRARANWPKYAIGDTLMTDGSLCHGTHYAAAQNEPSCEQFQPPPAQDTLGSSPHGYKMPSPHMEAINLTVLKFSRGPAALHDRLLNDGKLEDIRRALSSNGLSLRLNNGAYMFVLPDLYEAVADHISKEGLRVGPDHAVVNADWEQRVLQVVSSLPRKYKVSVRSRDTCEVLHACNKSQPTSKGSCIEIMVLRSFIEVKVPSSLFSGPSGGPRTASTTDADCRKRPNPRRAVKR